MLTPLGNKESDRHSRSRVAVKNLMMPGTPSQFLKFAMAGAAGTICHYATLLLWVEVLALPVVAGALAGFCVGALTNYLLARRFVFASGRPHASALPRFAAVATAGAAVNTGIVALLYGAGTHYVLAQVVATVAVLAWNFLANRFWTFAD
jgi:putative flippase GtrA